MIKIVGIIIIRLNIAITEPIIVNLIALYPSPSNKYLCPGKIVVIVSSEPAPSNIDGIKSMNVCVIESETMKITKFISFMFVSGIDRSDAAIKLMWIPGIKPVKVPARIPRSKANINSNIMMFCN